MSDWTGHSYVGTQHGRRQQGNLLGNEDRVELRRYLLRSLPPAVLNPGSAGHHEAIRGAISQALQDGVLGVSLPADPATISRLYAETVGLGPLDTLLGDASVTSITANGPGLLMVERMDQSGISFSPGFDSAGSLLRAMDALAQRAGRSLTPADPIVDLIWDNPNGASTRVHLNLLGRKAPFLALRRGRKQSIHLNSYVNHRRMNAAMAAFLSQAVQAGVSIVVTGMPGSGKTTLLEALLHMTTANQGHVVLVEDDPEVNVQGLSHVSAFQVPRPRPGEETPVGFLGLVLASLRMNCRSILVCGEVRGAEAGAIIAVMPSYRAVWLTVHGTTPADGLERLVAAAQMGGTRPPSPFSSGRQEHLVRRNLATGLQVIVQMSRLADDRIGVSGIHWLAGLDEKQEPALRSTAAVPVSKVEGWDSIPVFEVRQKVAGGELAVTWEANPDFRWPADVAARLAMIEIHTGTLDEAAFQAEVATAQAALDGNQPTEATRRLEDLYGLVSGEEQQRIVLGLLHRALLAQPARWETLLAEARRTKNRIEHLAREREWQQASRVLDRVDQNPQTAVALAQLDLETAREQIATGLEAVVATERATVQIARLDEQGQHWDALGLSVGLPLERLSPETAGEVVEMQAAQLRALQARAVAGDEEMDRVARIILRLLPPTYRELYSWAEEQLNEQRQSSTADALGDLLPPLLPSLRSQPPPQDDERLHALYVEGCMAMAAKDNDQARQILEPLGDYRNVPWLLATMERKK